jgi:hypothetical protein
MQRPGLRITSRITQILHVSCQADVLRLHEDWCQGGGPQGIFTVRPELLVPFVGEWAA